MVMAETMEHGTQLADSVPLANGQADVIRKISQNGGVSEGNVPLANGGEEKVEDVVSGRKAKEAERRRRRRTKKKKSAKKEVAGKADQSDSDKENADEVICCLCLGLEDF